MKQLIVLGLMCVSSVTFAATGTLSSKSSEREQVGYSFGYLMGKSNTSTLNDLDIDRFIEGFRQGYAGKPASLTNEQMVTALNRYKKRTEAAALTEVQQSAGQNLALGEKFLKENASKAGVKTTASGLQYLVLKQGNGQKPKANSSVIVNYEGRLLNGTVFDSSIARDQPTTLALNQVIRGWQEGLPLMNEGSKYRFFIPANLAYGEVGAGPVIEPNSTLIFDIELLKVNP